MEFIKLTDICNPKQWKTISTADFVDDGKYDVYGANGVIGRTNLYNHDSPTLLLTCRGATCGALNITKGKCYVNGNAMCLDNLSADFNLYFIYYYLKFYDMKKVISGTAQPQITINSLNKVLIPLISKERQEIIVRELKQIENSISIGSDQLLNFDEVVKSQFIEMFGDPILNEKGWIKEIISRHINVQGGYAFKSNEFIEEGVPVLRIGNINSGKFKSSNLVYWCKDSKLKNYEVYPGDLVLSLTGTAGKDDYGNICVMDNSFDLYYLNQRNAKLIINNSYNSYFLKELFSNREVKNILIGSNHGVRQGNILNKDILNLCAIVPPIELQNKFADFVQQIDKSKYFGGVLYA